MDWYLNFYSHHPIHVKRGLVRWLFERARNTITTWGNLQKEEEHVIEALKRNGYPNTFIRTASQALRDKEADQDMTMEVTDRTLLVVLPYITGVSEDIRQVCSRFGIRAAFRSGQTLWLMLTKVKDTLSLGK